MSASRYERIRMEGKTFFARILNEGERTLYFVKVNKEGDETEVKQDAQGRWVHIQHLVDKALITRRTPMVMSLTYAELEEAKS